jgi:hypothetical protein
MWSWLGAMPRPERSDARISSAGTTERLPVSGGLGMGATWVMGIGGVEDWATTLYNAYRQKEARCRSGARPHKRVGQSESTLGV